MYYVDDVLNDVFLLLHICLSFRKFP